MDQRSDEIRVEIEQTRAQLGETAEALGYKANVPQRTKDWVGEKKDSLVSTMSGHTPDEREVKERAQRLKDTAEQNPLGLAIAGAAAGFIAGMLTPSTRVEDERLGPVADEVKSAAAETGQEAIERAKDVAQETAHAATETAKQRGRQQGEELSSTLREKTAQAASSSDRETTTTRP
jgi:hypothetical protein